jgi:hypothetical protein
MVDGIVDGSTGGLVEGMVEDSPASPIDSA